MCRGGLGAGGLAMLVVLAGCMTGSLLDMADAGRTGVYEPGVPNFDMEAVATRLGDDLGVRVYAGVPPLSLVFIETPDGYRARFELRVRVVDERTERVVARESVEDTVRLTRFAETQALDATVHRVAMPVPPGRYLVEAVLEDPATGRTATRRQRVRVAEVADGPALSRIHLEAYRRGEARARPELALHLPAGLDSLRAVVELYQSADVDTLDLRLHLVRLESDTSVALPPFWFRPSTGSARYRGVFYGRGDTLLGARQRLVRPGPATVEFTLPRLEPGMYLLSIEGSVPGRARPEGPTRRRALSVKSATFPRVALLDQLIDALAYIATPRELEHIREGATPQERQARFDAFWGRLLADRQQAARLLEEYYSRVEAANLLYSSYKAGWKTDRGMVFIVRGPPLQVEQRADGEYWYYSFNQDDPEDTFFFKRVRGQERLDAFDQYVLERHPHYESEWRRAVQRWREGRVL